MDTFYTPSNWRKKTIAWVLLLTFLVSMVLPGGLVNPAPAAAAEAPGSSEATAIAQAQGTADAPKTINGRIWEDSVASGLNYTSDYDQGRDGIIPNVKLCYQWMDHEPDLYHHSKSRWHFCQFLPRLY